MENSRSGIYAIVNLVNGKRYIGQSQNLYARQCSHIGKLNCNQHPNKHLQNAWNKYGADQFEFQVLEYCVVEELDNEELFWIDYYRSNDTGYNIRLDPVNNRGLKWTDEQRKSMMEKINDPDGWFKNHSVPRSTMEKAWEATRNKVWTKEERERHSKIMTGKTVANTANMRAAQTGENNGDAKLTEQDVKEIIYLLFHKYGTTILSKVYGVSIGTVTAIKSCRSWLNVSRADSMDNPEIGRCALNRLEKYNGGISC